MLPYLTKCELKGKMFRESKKRYLEKKHCDRKQHHKKKREDEEGVVGK